MSVGANFAIRFKEDPTEEQIKQLRFHLLHRFKSILWWRKNDGTLRPLITKAEYDLGDGGEISCSDSCLYKIESSDLYYNQGYERGPGLEIAALLIYLCRCPDISEVYYGGDGRLIQYSENEAIELFSYWIDHGELPYRYGIPHLREPNAPICDWCAMPLIASGGNRDSYIWYCEGCEQTKRLPRTKVLDQGVTKPSISEKPEDKQVDSNS